MQFTRLEFTPTSSSLLLGPVRDQTECVTDELLEGSGWVSWRIKNFPSLYLQELLQVLRVRVKETSLCTLVGMWVWGEEVTFLKNVRAFCSLEQKLILRKTICQSFGHVGFYWSLSILRECKDPTPAPPALGLEERTGSLKDGGILENANYRRCKKTVVLKCF